MRWIEEATHGLEPHPREQPGRALLRIYLNASPSGSGIFMNLEISMSKEFVVGQYAEGQGGIYIGKTAQGRHLFAAAALLNGAFEFGGYGDELEDYSDLDGTENTRKLLARGAHPAAEAASEYTADGLADFYLPSRRELLQVVAVEGFNEDVSDVWTSTPCGSYGAWAVCFEGGCVYVLARHFEFRVRPVRSIIA